DLPPLPRGRGGRGALRPVVRRLRRVHAEGPLVGRRPVLPVRRDEARVTLLRRLGYATFAAAGVATARAALVAASDGYLAAGLTDVAVRSFARSLVFGLPGALAVAVVLALL